MGSPRKIGESTEGWRQIIDTNCKVLVEVAESCCRKRLQPLLVICSVEFPRGRLNFPCVDREFFRTWNDNRRPAQDHSWHSNFRRYGDGGGAVASQS